MNVAGLFVLLLPVVVFAVWSVVWVIRGKRQ